MVDVFLAARLTRALERAAIPIIGVSIRDEADRNAWVIQYAPAATESDRTAGEALKRSYDPSMDTAWQDEQAANAADGVKAIKTTLLWVLKRDLGRAPTPAEILAARDDWTAIYRALM